MPFLDWLLRRREAPPTIRQLVERVGELESRLDFLERDHTKLRGRLTGGLRRKEEPEPEPTPPPNGRPAVEAPLSLHRRAQRGF